MQAEHELLKTKAPEFADKERANKLWGEINGFFEKEGFTTGEVKALLNHKSILLVHEVIKYRALKNKAGNIPSKKVDTTPKPIKSGTGNSADRQKTESYKQLEAKARASGNIRDVVALFD